MMTAIALAICCLGSDYAVTRGTRIQSERPIWLLTLEAGLGVIRGTSERNMLERIDGREIGVDSTSLRVDGREQRGPTSAIAAWRLIGFVLWDGTGSIERTTTATVLGHRVLISDRIENGRVRVCVTIGPPLGDPRVEAAVLTLEATEDATTTILDGWAGWGVGNSGTRIRLLCSADLDLPGDRCRLVRRIAVRIAERDGGAELADRVRGLERVGRGAVLAGRTEINAIVGEFIRRVCR
jgi:hypothetical protein